MLTFLVEQGALERFSPRFAVARYNQFDEALAEVRAAFFLHSRSFQILQWEPQAEGGLPPGDLEIHAKAAPPIFVQVKSPGWESELLPDERKERKRQPKYRQGEARFIDSAKPVIYAICKSLPKFSTARENLVVIVDDLFLSPTARPAHWGANRVQEYLTTAPPAARVGGVLLIGAVAQPDQEWKENRVTGRTSSRIQMRFGPCQQNCSTGLLRRRGELSPPGRYRVAGHFLRRWESRGLFDRLVTALAMLTVTSSGAAYAWGTWARIR